MVKQTSATTTPVGWNLGSFFDGAPEVFCQARVCRCSKAFACIVFLTVNVPLLVQTCAMQKCSNQSRYADNEELRRPAKAPAINPLTVARKQRQSIGRDQ